MASTEKFETVALFLTPDEASFLSVVLCRIGGHHQHTHRGLADNISNALREAGYRWQDSEFYGGVTGSMNCSDKKGTQNKVGHIP